MAKPKKKLTKPKSKPVKKTPLPKKRRGLVTKKMPGRAAVKKRPPPGLLSLGVDKKGNVTLTDSKGTVHQVPPPDDEWLAMRDEMTWEMHEGPIDVVTCGACPVQSEGTVDGHPIYFRARHDAWTLDIGQKGGDPHKSRWDEEPGWQVFGDYGGTFDAGWMSGKHSRQCFLAAVESWRAAGGEKAPFGRVALDPRWPVPDGPEA